MSPRVRGEGSGHLRRFGSMPELHHRVKDISRPLETMHRHVLFLTGDATTSSGEWRNEAKSRWQRGNGTRE